MEYYIVKQPTSASFCGIAVIINHERFYRENENAPVLKDRDGSWKDIDALETVWKTFGFKTQIYCDLTDQEVVDLFEELRILDHSSYDAFVACYLSHGNEDVVYASNSKGIYIRKLVDIMANHCHTLNKKPKLFFIQACQGHQMGFSSYQETAGVESAAHFPTSRIQPVSIHLQTNNSTDLPQFADTLIFNSTVKGFVSLRIPNEESWFVASIKNNMLEHGGDLTIDSILKKVSNEVSMKIGCFDQYKNLKQQPIMISTLRFELKLKKMCA